MNEETKDERGVKPVETGSAESKTVRDAPFPHVDIPEEVKEGRNADHVPRVPEGPRRGPLGPTAPSTRKQGWQGSRERESEGHNR